jgi:hypothetical protein
MRPLAVWFLDERPYAQCDGSGGRCLELKVESSGKMVMVLFAAGWGPMFLKNSFSLGAIASLDYPAT